MIDEINSYQADRWVPSVITEKIWQAQCLYIIDVYIGSLQVIVHDAGKNFRAESFQMNADLVSIWTKEIPGESENLMSIVDG